MIALLILACGTPAPTPATGAAAVRPVTVALNWFPEPEFGGLYEAELGGAYDQAGFDVTIQAGGAGAPVIPQVATGRVAFGVAMADEVVLARAQGANVVAVFATYQQSPRCILVHASRGITDLSQLTSGTLALEEGVPDAQWITKKFGFAGVQRVPFGGGVTAWMLDPNYAQQAFVTSEPLVAKRGGGDPQCLMVSDTGYNPYANVLITSGNLIHDDPAMVDAFVAATKKGWEAYLADPTRANGEIAKLNPALTAEMLGEMATAQAPLVTSPAGLGAMDKARWEMLVTQLQEIGSLTAPVPADELYRPVR